MNTEIIGIYSLHNGEIVENQSDKANILNNYSTNIVYEVIRVIDGIPLFMEEHISRLLKSSHMVGIDISNIIRKIEADIKKLIEINKKPEKNFKILIYKDKYDSINYKMFFIKSNYPDSKLYENGISTILFKAFRTNPNAKVQNSQLRETINTELKKHNAYEALLINEEDYITEGSKSNVFFVKDNMLYTSPKQDVLLGVTRARVIELAKYQSITIKEEPIHKSFLDTCQGLFITGTSPKVLPVSKVDKMEFNSPNNLIIQKLMNAYDKLIENYINTENKRG